jgi:acetyl-CoA carboxylase carboxyltransferase component
MSNVTENVARKRIHDLLDEGSFLEIGSGITARSTDFNMGEAALATDGVITGYGTIDQELVYVYSQDASVLGGSIGEMHAAKICRIYEMAVKMGAPVIGLIDCAGLRLQEATDGLHGFGKLYKAQCEASGVVPQITAIFGNCGGGMALIPALSDFTFMEKQAKLFVNAPNTLDGNATDRCDTAAASYQTEKVGSADAGSEEEILSKIRQLISILPANNAEDLSYTECFDNLNRQVPEAANCDGDTGLLLQVLSDDGFILPVREAYHPEMVTAFIRLGGRTIGAVANRSKAQAEEGKETAWEKKLTYGSCEKAARFVRFCDAFEIPVLTITQVEGFAATMEEETGLPTGAAALTHAFAEATVPKVNLIVGEANGSAYLTMNSKAIGADLVYAWPDASISTMAPEAAARILYQKEIQESADKAARLKELADRFAEEQAHVQAAARRGYVDHIIQPESTRKYLIGAYEMLYTKREDRPVKKHASV